MATIPIVDRMDKRKGIIAAVIVMLGLFLYLILTSFEMADPPPKDIPLEVAEPLDMTEIEEFTIAGGAGGGDPSTAPVDQPQPQTENVLTQTNSNSQTNSGNANNTNSPNSDNQASTTQQSNNPFAQGGSGGGDGSGDGTGFGNDSGTGTDGSGAGPGSGAGRKRLNNVNIADLQYNSDETIYLKLVIDAQGNVVQVYNIKGQTTTTDQILINKVKVAVKKQVKYNKQEHAPLATVYYTVKVNAQ